MRNSLIVPVITMGFLTAACSSTNAEGISQVVTNPVPSVSVSTTVAPEVPATVGTSVSPDVTYTYEPPPPPPKPVKVRIADTVPGNTGGSYGVGLPLEVSFSKPLTRKQKRIVQSVLVVETSNPVGPAAWSWLDSDTVAFRPKTFWPENTKIKFKVPLDGVELGFEGDRPIVGEGSKTVKLKIVRNQVTTINLGSQWGIVKRDGKKVKTFPVSTGKPGFDTRQGVKIIHEKVTDKVFTGDAFNEDYRLVSAHALRLTWTGEFLHSAPWATGRLGRYPGSHGCTNMSNADAAWFYRTSVYGDPVIFGGKKSAPMMTPGNGYGGLWNIPWATWKANSYPVKGESPLVTTFTEPTPEPEISITVPTEEPELSTSVPTASAVPSNSGKSTPVPTVSSTFEVSVSPSSN